jgi:hypothetical protein
MNQNDRGIASYFSSHNNTYTNITASNNDYAIDLQSSNENIFRNITLKESSYHKLVTWTSQNNRFIGLNIWNCTYEQCIYLMDSSYNTINDSIINLTSEKGITISSTSHSNNISIQTYQTTGPDIYIEGDNNTILDSNLSSTNGIVINASVTVYTKGILNFTNNAFNITSDDVTLNLQDSQIFSDGDNADRGIIATYTENLQINDGSLFGFGQPIDIRYSNNTLIDDLTVTDIFTKSGSGGDHIAIDTRNTKNTLINNSDLNRPVYRDFSTNLGLLIQSTDNLTIDRTLINNTYCQSHSCIGSCIEDYGTSTSTIINSVINNCQYGTEGLSNSTVKNSQFSSNTYLEFTNDNLLINNTIENNTGGDIFIALNNQLYNNTFDNFYRTLIYENNNILTGNNMTNCDSNGFGCLHIWDSDYNVITENYINSSKNYTIYIDETSEYNNISSENYNSSGTDVLNLGNYNRVGGTFTGDVGIVIF